MKIKVVEKLSSFKLINSEEIFYAMPCNGPFQQVIICVSTNKVLLHAQDVRERPVTELDGC